MKLDPVIAALIDVARADGPTTDQITPQQARALHEGIAAAMAGEAVEVGRVHDFAVRGPGGEIESRIYYPQGAGPFPALLFIHGGGWVGGNLATHDVLCRQIVVQAGCAVAALAYRLAPEHKFPAAYEDCIAFVEYMLDHSTALNLLADRIAIGGDSAGGNLAAAVTHALRGRAGNTLMLQFLAYPGTDLRMTAPSYVDARDAPGLTSREVAWCVGHYLASAAEIVDPRASPMLAADFSGLPPAIIVTAEVDPLRDDGEAYARRLVEAGVPVQVRRYLGLPHGFLSFPQAIQPTAAALAEVCGTLRLAFLPYRS